PWDPPRPPLPDPTLSGPARPAVRPRRLDGGEGGPDRASRDGGAPLDEEALAARWIDDLRRFERAADSPGAPAVLVDFESLDAVARFGAGIPTPVSAALAATAEPSPSVRVALEFADEAEARRFAEAWPRVL